MDWSAEAIERLRALWAEGHSTAEIGRRMGISKNAVVGKAHRLNLPARPSPIRREAGAVASRPQPVRASRPVLPAPRSTLPQAAQLPASGALPVGGAGVVRGAVPAMTAARAVVRPFPRAASARACCWPIGEPGQPGFRFCSGDALSGKPYCAEHAAVAYVKARDRREDAA
ncbi:MAG TPA: GcrA family cell cycle regulator [Falsiroseomonas sp.]|jgi:GcrA cell cycle regulator|nr:GcrA family cell cycle regulator [Falsiroseomonas sp.]